MRSLCVVGESGLATGPALESSCSGLIRVKHRIATEAHTVAMLLESVLALEGICIGIAGDRVFGKVWRRGRKLTLIDRMWRCPWNI